MTEAVPDMGQPFLCERNTTPPSIQSGTPSRSIGKGSGPLKAYG